MNTDAPGQNDPLPETLTANAEMVIGGYKLKLKLEVPTAEMPAESMLPALRALCNQVVDGVEETARKNGSDISCRAGCGACCRQYVPISPAEARMIAELVERMPEERKTRLKRRFSEAAERFRASAVKENAMNYNRLPTDERIAMIKDYFRLGIACPFLEDESCSIYADRPLICREYLVISSPEHCATLDEGGIRRLQLPVSVAQTFSEMEGVRRAGVHPCLPLVLALEWTADHPEEQKLLPGTRWVQYFFEDLSGADIPDADATLLG